MNRLILCILLCLWSSTAFTQYQLTCDFEFCDTLSVTIENDSIIISNVKLCGYCSSKYDVIVTHSSDTIHIMQTDTSGIIATCQCLFDIDVVLTGLDAGKYTAVVDREFLKKYSYPKDTVIHIGSIKFELGECRGRIRTICKKQSGCLPLSIDYFDNTIPSKFTLFQNYPNPFNPTSSIEFQIPRRSFVTISIYDLLGKKVQTLMNEEKPAVDYKVEINGHNLPSGIYLCRMQSGLFTETKKILLSK